MKKTAIRDYEILSKIADHEEIVTNAYVVRKNQTEARRLARVFALEDMSPADINRIIGEIKIIASIRHPNVLMYYDAFVDEKLGLLIIISEYCEQGNLRVLVEKKQMDAQAKKKKYLLDEEVVLDILVQVVLGMREVKRFNIVHRNMKVSNLYLNSEGTVKVGDFTFANFEKLNKMTTQIGTPQYASPEVFLELPYTIKSDVWSLGVVLHELTFGKLPFESQDFMELKELVEGRMFQFPKTPAGSFENIKFMIDWCLDLDPAERPNLEDILQQKFLLKHLKAAFTFFPELVKIEKENMARQLLHQISYDPKSKNYAELNRQLQEVRRKRVEVLLDGSDDIDHETGFSKLNRASSEYESGRAPLQKLLPKPGQKKVDAVSQQELERHGAMTNEIKRFGNSRFLEYRDFREKVDREETILKHHGPFYKQKLITPDKPLQLQGDEYSKQGLVKRWNFPNLD